MTLAAWVAEVVIAGAVAGLDVTTGVGRFAVAEP
jgi:hypothetical protein